MNAGLIGAASSTLPCGILMPDEDVVGDNLGSVAGTADNEACLAACEAFDGCIAAIRNDENGNCFFKSVDIYEGESLLVPGFTSFVRCDFSATAGAQ